MDGSQNTYVRRCLSAGDDGGTQWLSVGWLARSPGWRWVKK